MGEALLVRRQGGTKLPELTNEGSDSDLLFGKELIDADGKIVTGNIPTKTNQDIIIDGAEISVPSGYYAEEINKSINKTDINSPSIEVDENGLITASVSQSEGYIDAGTKNTTRQLTTKAATTITPSTSNQTIAAGTYLTGTQTIAGDGNLVAGNIKNGISIFGITGTFSDNSDKLINRSITECINNDVTTIGSYVFYNCRSLTSVSFPVCTSIGGYAFNGCTSLTSVNFPACTSIASQAFRYCSSLTSANFPICANIGSSAFGGCSKLASLTLGASSVCTLYNSNAFTGTPMSVSTYIGKYGSIYVPASLVSSYKSATNWTRYSSRITSI